MFPGFACLSLALFFEDRNKIGCVGRLEGSQKDWKKVYITFFSINFFIENVEFNEENIFSKDGLKYIYI